MTSIRLNIKIFILTIFSILALLGASFYQVEIDTDINRFLPQKDTVLSDAAVIFKHHPMQGEMVIDIGIEKADPDLLVRCAQFVEARIQKSGLFHRVGTESVQRLIPSLFNRIADNLPLLFTRQELMDHVLPLLSPDQIHHQITLLQDQLLQLDAIGQSEFIARDPLALRHLIMAKLSYLAPSGKINIYKGKLISEDKKHLLVTAAPALSGTDTAFAKKLQALMNDLSLSLPKDFDSSNSVVLTPMGAYRAALDNETIARRDVKRAILFATMGIALLLIFAFPRPVLGLFAFLPAVAGTAAAFFVLSFFHETISIMALGFGGAIISITVDHGIAYLLFLDRSRTAYGRDASSEIWAIGLVATLTTVGAFAALCLTDFPIFVQLGQFTAFGIAFTFLFIHFVFPKIFPELPPANVRPLLFRKGVSKLPAFGSKAALTAMGFAMIMGFFASPKFNVNLSAMNTVSRSTAAAEQLMNRVWGGSIFSKIYMMTEEASYDALQKTGDQLLLMATVDMAEGRLESGFLPSMVFPGEAAAQHNFNDWKSFWTPERIEKTRHAIISASKGEFKENAFMPFYDMISAKAFPDKDLRIPEKFHSLMGIVREPSGLWRQFAAFTPGENYNPKVFYKQYNQRAHIFDSSYFSDRLGNLLFYSFMKMVFIVGACVAALLFIFFLDVKLTLITLAPVAFALVSTLGHDELDREAIGYSGHYAGHHCDRHGG